MPKGASHSKYCTLDILKHGAPTINLFKIRRSKGWWPFKANDSDDNVEQLAVNHLKVQKDVVFTYFFLGKSGSRI